MPKVTQTKYGEFPAIRFHCPGCGFSHVVTIQGSRNNSGATWQFNGDFESPTINPSILSTHEWEDHSALTEDDYGPWLPHPTVEGAKSRDVKPGALHKLVKHKDICHSFVKDGKIQFLGDCTHKLAGQTVDLPECAD